MKCVATPSFQHKASQLSAVERRALARAISFLEESSAADLLSHNSSRDGLTPLGNDVYATRAGPLRLFVTFSSAEANGNLILLDLTQEHPQERRSLSFGNPAIDPRVNSLINPKVNSLINPKANSLINPKANSLINPKANSLINPKANSLINPKANSSINPKFNTSINPKFNPSVNPKFNFTINPAHNPSYSGPFLFDLDLKRLGFLVRASDQVILKFNESSDWVGFLVRWPSGGYSEFDVEGNWVGYLVDQQLSVMPRFDLSGNWIGFAAPSAAG